MPNTEQLLYQTGKNSHQRFPLKRLFLKILQYSWENTSVKLLITTILKNTCIWLPLNWLYEMIVWNFIRGLHLKPSQLSDTRKIPVALNKIWSTCWLYIWPLCFLINLGLICSSLTVTTQKANACSPWIPCKKM